MSECSRYHVGDVHLQGEGSCLHTAQQREGNSGETLIAVAEHRGQQCVWMGVWCEAQGGMDIFNKCSKGAASAVAIQLSRGDKISIFVFQMVSKQRQRIETNLPFPLYREIRRIKYFIDTLDPRNHHENNTP